MAIYSHSKIGTYESCPQKYKFQYIDKIKGDIESVEAFLGSRVHEALENLYKCVRNGRLLSEEEILAFYESAWETNWSEDVQIVESGLRAEHYRKIGRQCVQDYYRHYHPFDQGRVLDTEKRLAIKLDADGRYQMVGFVDRIDKVGDGVFEIHDYKTNRSLPSQAEKDKSRLAPHLPSALSLSIVRPCSDQSACRKLQSDPQKHVTDSITSHHPATIRPTRFASSVPLLCYRAVWRPGINCSSAA